MLSILRINVNDTAIVTKVDWSKIFANILYFRKRKFLRLKQLYGQSVRFFEYSSESFYALFWFFIQFFYYFGN